MSGKQPVNKAKRERKAQPRDKPSLGVEQVENQVELDELTTKLVTSTEDLIQTPTSPLNNPGIPLTQRQSMAAQAGKVGGNQYLQGVVQQMKQPSASTLVQRHSTTPLKYEEDTIQPKLLEGSIQRHSTTPLKYEEDTIQPKLISTVIQRRTLVEKLNEAMDGWGTDEQAIFDAINSASDPEKREALRDPRLIARLRDELSRSEALRALTNLGAPLTLRLEVAMDGFWAESQEILQMINNLPAAQAAEKQDVLRNPKLMARLRDKLSREDALKSMEGLGAPLAERLRAAMDGWGVDVAAIETMINKAGQPEKQAAVRDRALIDRLKNEVSQDKLYTILGNLGVSLVDRLNAAMDGWGVNSEAVINLSRNATDPEKAQVLADSATITRLSRELSWEDTLIVMKNLGVSLADRLHLAMQGWGADSQAILTLIPEATQDQRLAVYADTGMMGRLESELSAEDYRQATLLLRFGSQKAIDAASAEQLAAKDKPDNLTAKISAQLDSRTPDAGKILNDVAAASDTDREMVRQNHSLLQRLAEKLTQEQMRQILDGLGGSIVDRLNLLLLQQATAVDILALVNNANADNKQLVLNNRALLDRLLEHLDEANDRALLTALGDTLTNQLDHALSEGANVTTFLNLISAATVDGRNEVKTNSSLMNRLDEALPAMNYWKVRLHLEFGQPSAYPTGLATLVTTWEGDSSYATLRRTLANLSTPDFNVIKTVPGIRDFLRETITDDTQFMFLQRMLDQGLITEENDVSSSFQETLMVDADPSPALNWQPRNFTVTQGFDVAYYRDKVQVEVRVALAPQDDQAKTDLSAVSARWETMIENAWDSRYNLQNTNHTLPIRINCNFTKSDPHFTVNVYSNPNPTWPAYNAANWYYAATNYSQYAPVHEFGHMLGNADEYNLSQAAYQATVGQNPTTDPQAVPSAADPSGTVHYTNPSVMGGNTPTGIAPGPGSIEKRHLNYFTNWINTNRRKNADGTFAEPAFTLV